MTENHLKDWPEDFAEENGKYLNQCLNCKSSFYGHKRRMICKECEQGIILQQKTGS